MQTDSRTCCWPICDEPANFALNGLPVCDRDLKEIDRIGYERAAKILGVQQINRLTPLYGQQQKRKKTCNSPPRTRMK